MFFVTNREKWRKMNSYFRGKFHTHNSDAIFYLFIINIMAHMVPLSNILPEEWCANMSFDE